MPPKDTLTNTTIIYTDYTNGYPVLFYYSALFLLSNDPDPGTMQEIAACYLFVLIGSITLGILIAQFSSLIN
jgi:hypothetical protein